MLRYILKYRAPRKVQAYAVPYIPLDFSRLSGRKQCFLLIALLYVTEIL